MGNTTSHSPSMPPPPRHRRGRHLVAGTMADNGFTRTMQKFAEQLVFEVPLEFASENGGVSRRNLELAWTFGEIALVRRDIFNFTHRAKDPTKLALVMIVWELKTIHMKLRARVREISREIYKMRAKVLPMTWAK